ncbi:hypothetical protein [Brevundimonas sp. M20]|nr:hypothetical protein [Brevundimonas sp. M20]
MAELIDRGGDRPGDVLSGGRRGDQDGGDGRDDGSHGWFPLSEG